MNPLRRLSALFRRSHLDREMDEEMRAHLERETEQNLARGLSPQEARYAAQRAFGGVEQFKERERDARGFVWLEQLAQDVRYALRQLARAPGFTLVVVLTLALGLGVNSTVFMFVSDFFLRPLPVKEPERLVYVMQQSPRFGVPLGFSVPDYRDFSAAAADDNASGTSIASAFSGLLLYRQMPVALSRGATTTERTWMAAVSANFFDVIGVGATQGRVFSASGAGQSGSDPVIVLTHGYWMKRFGGDPGIVGQTVSINGVACTVIGITTPGFHGPQWTDALSGFVPMTLLPQLTPADRGRLENRGQLGNMMMGRLRSGVTAEQARAAADVMLASLIQRFPDEHAPARALVVPERLSRPSPAAAGFTPIVISVLMLGALLVLAVAIANATNLFFARAADRERELAMRAALGASRARLIRQSVVEAALMALIAGGVGLLLVRGANVWLNSMVVSVSDVPPVAEHGLDWRLFAGTVTLALVAGVLAALMPALKATRRALVPLLNAGMPTTTGVRHRLRSFLVVLQVALSCIVLISAGHGVRSVHALSGVNPGFKSDHLLLASYDLGLQRYVARHGLERARQFHTTLLDRVRALPGVSDASLTAHVPFDIDGGGGNLQGQVTAAGNPVQNDPGAPLIPVVPVDYAYLHTMGIPLLHGRDFAESDTATSPLVAIINEAMAARLWPALSLPAVSSSNPSNGPALSLPNGPGESAVGRQLVVAGGAPMEVIGIVPNGRFLALADAGRPHVFIPLSQNFRGAMTLVVRAEGDPLALAPSIERLARELEPELPVFNVRTMEQQIGQSPMGLMPLRFGATMVGAQGVLALALALTGIYGLVSFQVGRRTREIGVRMALGATSANVVRVVAKQGVRLTLTGLVLGLPLAYFAIQPLRGLLYGASTTDALVFACVALLILAIALLASWLPAWRATRVNPIDALRAE